MAFISPPGLGFTISCRLNEKYRVYDGNRLAYTCFPNRGAGVEAYVLDTGIRTSHFEFQDLPFTPVSIAVGKAEMKTEKKRNEMKEQEMFR